MHCLLTETPLYRHKALRGKAQWCYLWGGACPGASQGTAGAAPGRDPPGRCLFLCYLFSPAIFEVLSLLHAEGCQRQASCFFTSLSVDLLLGLVFCFVLVGIFFHKIILFFIEESLAWRTAELLPDFDLS